MHPEWTLKHPRASHEMLGFIPYFLDTGDPRSAKEQFNSHQPGGWHTTRVGFKMADNALIPPGEPAPDNPAVPLIAETKLRDETIRFYNGAWVAIIQPDGMYEIARLD